MEITLIFRDDDARTVTYYLRRRYKARSTAKLERLAMVAIRREVTSEAEKELDELTPKVIRYAKPIVDKCEGIED